MSRRGTIKSWLSLQLGGWGDFRRSFTGGQLPGDRDNGRGGGRRSFAIYLPTDAHDARCIWRRTLWFKFSSQTLLFVRACRGFLPGDGPHCLELCLIRPKERKVDKPVAAAANRWPWRNSQALWGV